VFYNLSEPYGSCVLLDCLTQTTVLTDCSSRSEGLPIKQTGQYFGLCEYLNYIMNGDEMCDHLNQKQDKTRHGTAP